MKHLWEILALSLAPVFANAALHSRAGGQAYYDDVLDITWLANANLAATEAFGVSGIDQVTNPGGVATWYVGQDWIAAMRASNGGLGYLGVNNWRLPKTVQPDSYCASQYAPPGFPSQGSSVGCTRSELPHLAFVDGIFPGSPSPFTNIKTSNYWSGTSYAPDITQAWEVYMVNGGQGAFSKNAPVLYLWPVVEGDIGDRTIDIDNDGLLDDVDNCTLVANSTQCDSDGDGYGNRCDADMNNNGSTNAQDTVLFRQQLGQPSVGPTFNKADLNCNGAVNAQDTTLFRQLLGSPPGPSGQVP